MSKSVKYIVGLVAILLVIWFSLDIQKLDAYKATNKTEVFNAENYAENVWKNEMPAAIESATDVIELLQDLETDPMQTFSQFGKKLGISKTWYFLVLGNGEIKAVEDEAVVVQLDNGKQIQLATSFIFGNAVREASGVVNIDDFINMTDFNNVSIALNKKVKEEIIPKLKSSAEPGKHIEFAGAIEMNEASPQTNNVRIIPVAVEFDNAD